MALVEKATIYRNIDVGTTGAVVKDSAGMLIGGIVSNANAAARFLKLYNKATAPTQADTPAMTVRLPASSTIPLSVPNGVEFSAGISIRASTGVADNDTGAPSSNETIVNLFYA